MLDAIIGHMELGNYELARQAVRDADLDSSAANRLEALASRHRSKQLGAMALGIRDQHDIRDANEYRQLLDDTQSELDKAKDFWDYCVDLADDLIGAWLTGIAK